MTLRDVLRFGRHKKSRSASSSSSADSVRTPTGSPVAPGRSSLSRETKNSPDPAPAPASRSLDGGRLGNGDAHADGVVVIGPDRSPPPATPPRVSAQSPSLPALPSDAAALGFDPANHDVAEAERPPPVVSTSAAGGAGADARVGGAFRHVQSVLPVADEGAVDKALPETPGETSAPAPLPPASLDDKELPAAPKSADGRPSAATAGPTAPAGSASATAGPSRAALVAAASPSTAAGLPPFVAARGPDTDVDAHLAPFLDQLNLGAPRAGQPVVPGTTTLEEHRDALVGQLFEGSARARAERGEVGEKGRQVFGKAGMGETLDEADTVDTHTQWLEPVVHEYIRPIEHTDYETVITREVHKHHIYPKIQPISDPNPTVLPAKHRIFSSVTNAWHEVDEATAREVLGAAFDSGAREVREERRLALPDWRDGVCDAPYDKVGKQWVVPAKDARRDEVGQAL